MGTLSFTLIVVNGLAIPFSAFAYLDPGTGSMVLQMVLGGVAGILVVGKLYWQRIKAFFGGKSERPRTGDSTSHNDAK